MKSPILKSFLCATLALGIAGPAAAKKMPAPKGKRSKAVSKALVDALAQELERSMTMRIPGAPAPYFVSYKLTEVDVLDATATLGAVTASTDRHFVSIEAHVHVGSYKLDNTNFAIPRAPNIDGIATAQLPLEATPAIARKLAWLATDQAYKEAVQQFRAKRDALRSGAPGGDAESHAKAPTLVIDKPVLVPTLDPLTTLEARARNVSKQFAKHKGIRDSRVSFTTFLERRWYLNSEGTSSQDTRRVSGVLVAASSQADDGQGLNMYYSKYGRTEADLPSNSKLLAEADKLAKRLIALRSAPLVESYTGPVLFEGEGAVGITRYTLANHLSGTPLPVGVSAQEAALFGGGLLDRYGRRVLASNMSIYDDPTAKRAGKTPLIGGFLFDDEGVKAQRIDIIKGGKLITLPMSRTPGAKQKLSNGHARRSVEGGLFRGAPTNLFITGRAGKSRKQLIRQLTQIAKKEGLPYGLIIKQFEDYAVTANPELSRVEMFQLLQGVDTNAPPIATLAYRVLPNGKEELVRGVQLKRLDVDKWRQIAAVGRANTTKNFLASSENPALVRIQGGDQGFVASAGVESSITVPDLLFPEITIERSTFGRRAKPAVPHP